MACVADNSLSGPKNIWLNGLTMQVIVVEAQRDGFPFLESPRDFSHEPFTCGIRSEGAINLRKSQSVAVLVIVICTSYDVVSWAACFVEWLCDVASACSGRASAVLMQHGTVFSTARLMCFMMSETSGSIYSI